MKCVAIGCLVGLLLCSAGRMSRADNWPQFRGATGQGESGERHLPVNWSKTENVAWNVEVPGIGWSSPIVWGDRVFVSYTSGDGSSCHVMCVDGGAGKTAWDVEVFRQTPTRKEEMNSYSTPTPVTNGTIVAAVFGEGGIAGLTFDGKIAWTNLDNRFYSRHGLGASPAVYKDLMVLNFDGSTLATGPQEYVGWQKPWDNSYVLALDLHTGKPRWKTIRGASRIGHTMPRFIEVEGQMQVVTTAGDVIQGLNPQTGEQIWRAFNEGETPVPSPVTGDGLLFTSPGWGAKDGPALRCWRLGGRGDVTKSNLVWETRKSIPTIPSYLYHDHRLYAMKEDGILQCFEGATGKLLWKHRLPGVHYTASPVWADGKIYMLDENGLTTVIGEGPEFQEIANNGLEEATRASMAVSNGRLFIRTKQHLYCIGNVAQRG